MIKSKNKLEAYLHIDLLLKCIDHKKQAYVGDYMYVRTIQRTISDGMCRLLN